MAMAPQKSKPLHNFDMPLSWGNQKLLRCMKVDSNGDVSAVDRRSPPELHNGGSTDRRHSLKSSSSSEDVNGRKNKLISDEGIEAVRTKLMFDLQTEADKMKDVIFREGLEEERPLDEARPWNLRTRRAACKAPDAQLGLLKPNFSPLRTEIKSIKLRGGGSNSNTSSQCVEKRPRAKFSISLSRREIEEDFMAMTGNRLPRRPKKRPRNLQKDLDMIFPGLWLTEINADLYKVPDCPDPSKR